MNPASEEQTPKTDSETPEVPEAPETPSLTIPAEALGDTALKVGDTLTVTAVDEKTGAVTASVESSDDADDEEETAALGYKRPPANPGKEVPDISAKSLM